MSNYPKVSYKISGRRRERKKTSKKDEYHTVNHGYEMRVLCLAVLDVDSHSNQGINCDIMNATLQVKLQVFALVAKELALFDDDADFLW